MIHCLSRTTANRIMKLHTLIIIQTIIGVLGIVPSYLLGVASIMSAANGEKHLKLAGFVITIGLALPFVLGISLIAMWIAHVYGWDRTALGFLILPWAHGLLLIISTLGLFRS